MNFILSTLACKNDVYIITERGFKNIKCKINNVIWIYIFNNCIHCRNNEWWMFISKIKKKKNNENTL